MSGSGLTTADYDPATLAGIASATGGPGASTSLGPLSTPRAPQPTPEIRERAARPRPEVPVTSGAADAVSKEPRQLATSNRSDPSTWGPKRTPDDLTRFWSQQGGLTPIAAQGVALAAQQESGLHPWAPGDFKDGQMTSFGTYQHHNERLQGLQSFAAKNGLDPNDGHTQDLFALHETQTDPALRSMMTKLNAAQTPQEAQAIWRKEFERPASITPNMPYAPTAWDEGKLAMGNQFLSQMMQEFRAGKENVARVDKDYKPVHIAEQPKPPDPDPLKAFGSLAGIFSQLAAGFSRTPAIAAMNGMAGAINAAKEHDWEQYAAQSKAWKENTDLAFKAHEQHSKDVNDAFAHLSTNVSLAHAMLEATTALSKDEQMAKHLANQDYEGAVKLQLDRDKAAREARDAAPLAFASDQLNTAQTLLSDAMKAGDPDQINKARANYDEALKHYQEIKQAPYSGRVGAQDAAMKEAFFKEHPGATIEDWAQFYQRYVKGKEDPAITTARKDRAEVLKETHETNWREINEDKTRTTREIADARIGAAADWHKQQADLAVRKLDDTATTADRKQNEQERHHRITENITSDWHLTQAEKDVLNRNEAIRWHDLQNERGWGAIESRENIADRQISSRERLATEKWKQKQESDAGSVKAERYARFQEAKAGMPLGTSETALWDKVDQQIQEARSPHISEFGLRSAAERFIAGDKTALQGFGRNPTLFGKIESKIAEIAQERGLTGTDLTKLQQDFQVATKALKDFATGKQGQTAQAMNVATQHLTLLGEAAKALSQNDSQTLNALENAFKNEFGWDEPITFNAIKTIVGSEVEKAVSGSSGAVTDREELRAGLRANATDNQLHSVIEAYKGLMAGQLQGLERTYERTTKRTDFREEFLLPEARKEMDRIAPRGDSSSTGVIRYDTQGNRIP